MKAQVPTFENQLIRLLPRTDALRLMKRCELVQLQLAEVLSEAGSKTRYAYFPHNSFISLVALAAGTPGVEVGMVGREGFLGSQIALGIQVAPVRAVVQGAGAALRIGASALASEMQASAALRRVLSRYIYVLMAQQAASSACLRFHLIGERLARWLLMSQDRAGSDQFKVTQEFLAYMLGMRRVGVTTAAGVLQAKGLIEYSRGTVRILDRAELEKSSCGCYASDRKLYCEQLI